MIYRKKIMGIERKPLTDRDKVIITAILGGIVFVYLMYIRPAPRVR